MNAYVNTLIHTLIGLQQVTSLLFYSVRKPSTILFWWSDFQNWRHFHAYFSLSHFPFSLFHLFHWLKHSSWMIKHFATNTLKLIRAIDKSLLLPLLVYVCELAHNLEKDVRYAISKKNGNHQWAKAWKLFWEFIRMFLMQNMCVFTTKITQIDDVDETIMIRKKKMHLKLSKKISMSKRIQVK